MSRDSLFSIINHWKNEAYHLSHQLKSLKNDYQQKQISFQSPTMNITEDLFDEVFINQNELRTNSSHQISLLYHLFLNHLKTLLIKQIVEEESTRRKTFPIMNLIETNIEQIGSLINQMNEDCLKKT